MTGKKVTVFQPGEGSSNTAQTYGMEREELIATPNSWVGMVHTKPGTVSGWHHHGDYDTYVYTISGKIKFDFGKDGTESCFVNPGEVAYIPKDTIHRESNIGKEELVVFLVRVGQGAPVVNVDGP